MPHRGLAGNVCAGLPTSTTLSPTASKDLALSQYGTIQLQLLFDIIGFPICFLCLKRPFRTTITLSATSTAPMLISGVFNCCSVPHHLKAPWYLQDFGRFILTAHIFKYRSICCPPLTRVKEFPPYISYISGSCSAIQQPYISASHIAKIVCFPPCLQQLLSQFWFVYLFFFLIILYWQHLHFIPKYQSMSWERIPSCDNRTTYSTMESPRSLFLERAFPSPRSRYKVTPTPLKAGFSFVLKGLASQLRFQAYLSG